MILVLNGGHTNCMSPFEHEEFFLKKGYKLVIPSRPGYGKTPSSSGKKAKALSSLNSQQVFNGWNEKECQSVLEFLLVSRSGSGFLNDIKHTFTFDKLNRITVPTLIIASSNDKSVSPLNSTY